MAISPIAYGSSVDVCIYPSLIAKLCFTALALGLLVCGVFLLPHNAILLMFLVIMWMYARYVMMCDVWLLSPHSVVRVIIPRVGPIWRVVFKNGDVSTVQVSADSVCLSWFVLLKMETLDHRVITVVVLPDAVSQECLALFRRRLTLLTLHT